MNHINDAIVTPARIQKAKRIGRPGSVERLAAFVCVESTDAWRVFEGCQLQRLLGLQSYQAADYDDRLVMKGWVKI